MRVLCCPRCLCFFFNATPPTEIYTLSLHDALPISGMALLGAGGAFTGAALGSKADQDTTRSEEHTSELQSRGHLVCRLLLEKKKIGTINSAKYRLQFLHPARRRSLVAQRNWRGDRH